MIIIDIFIRVIYIENKKFDKLTKNFQYNIVTCNKK